jgi:hypothetical protein
MDGDLNMTEEKKFDEWLEDRGIHFRKLINARNYNEKDRPMLTRNHKSPVRGCAHLHRIEREIQEILEKHKELCTEHHDCIAESAIYIKMNVVPEVLRKEITDALANPVPNIMHLCAEKAGWSKEVPKITKEQIEKIRKYFYPKGSGLGIGGEGSCFLTASRENVISALKSAGLEVEDDG